MCNNLGVELSPGDEESVIYFYKNLKCDPIRSILSKYKPRTSTEISSLYKKYKSFGKSSYTFERLEFIYELEEANRRWQSYCNKQAKSNSLEYKKQKYGMTDEEFKNYNKSRAVTLENLIKRYGKEIGSKKWEEYKNKQSYTKSESYQGTKKYKESCRKKGHTYEVYLERYGTHDEATRKLEEFMQKTSVKGFYSKQSQELCKFIHSIIKDFVCHYAENGGEYCIANKENCFKYDFVCPKLKIIVEYDGDHYHGNPRLYKPDETLKGRGMKQTTAQESWKADEIKSQFALNNRGFDLIRVWEYDWVNENENTRKKLNEYFTNRRIQFGL